MIQEDTLLDQLIKMAKLCVLFEGRMGVIRTVFISLLLFMAVLMVCREFRDWVMSGTVNMYLTIGYQTDAVDNTNDSSDSSKLVHNASVPRQMPTACEFPQIDPYEPSVMKVAGMDRKTLQCHDFFMPDLTRIDGSDKIIVDMAKIKEHPINDGFQHCRYRNIYRHDTNDDDFKYGPWSEPFSDTTELPKGMEFFKVECTDTKSNVVSKTFYHLVPEKEQFAETDSLNLMKRKTMTSPKETLSVIMIGFDTLMRNQFIRGCNETYSYLMNTLNSFDLTLHSQVGENTFPNFVPIFTGYAHEEVQRWWTDKYHMDTFDMIWGTFEKAGYQTMYTEDSPLGGAFHYMKKGFINDFARYHIRPLTLAIESDKDMFSKNPHCIGNQVEMNFHLEYLTQFLDMFPNKPVFAVVMISKPTHDDPGLAKMFDEHLLRYYQSWYDKGHLNRSVLISFSDHGVRVNDLRNTVNGHVESKTPYTILTLPEWFLKKYPDVAANLRANTKRLTAHFDTHATLLDLLYFKSDSPPPLPPLKHGISLFEKIPWDRTCKDAVIPADLCLCGYKGLEEVDVNSVLSQALTTQVIQALNSKTDKTLCAVYTLDKIHRILKIARTGANSADKQETFMYKVKLEVIPGNAVFEANVYSINDSSTWNVGAEIDRLNLYRGQADCLEFPTYRPFCYCNNLLSN